MIDPNEITAARRALGRLLAQYRVAAGLNQHQLAPLAHYGRSTIANVETGRQNVPRAFWQHCDDALRAQGQLIAASDRLEHLVRRQHQETARLAATDSSGQRQSPEAAAVAAGPKSDGAWPVAPLAMQDRIAVGSSEGWRLPLPPGRYFGGSTIAAVACRAVDDGRVVADLRGAEAILGQAGHGLVIGMVPDLNGDLLYGLDSRAARRRLGRSRAGGPVALPHAYLLDDLTFAVTWAVTNMDESLLGDDALLADQRERAASYRTTAQSSVGRDAASGLTAVSQMWLGSDFCAQHVLRHVEQLDHAPAFWTREQYGEEAATWLLFRHKYEYLSRLAGRFDDAEGLTRTFCVPPAAVAESEPYERILLLLTAALMESFGVRVNVCIDPAYLSVEGYVLDRTRRAIVANWIGANGIWHVDVTDDRPRLREYEDILNDASAQSLTVAETAARRLWAMSDYLRLDWDWLVRRCAEFGDYGAAGLAEPRSRLLSAAGLDRANRYLGALRTADGP
jgi:Helix-turn-helix domain